MLFCVGLAYLPYLGHAADLEREFSKLAGSFNDRHTQRLTDVEPLSDPLSIAYRPYPSTNMRAHASVRITLGDSNNVAVTDTVIERVDSMWIDESDNLVWSTIIEDYSFDSQTRQVNVTPDAALPEGAKILMVSDNRGNLLEASIEPPKWGNNDDIPQSGTPEFSKVINDHLPKVLEKSIIAQGDTIFAPILYSIGSSEDVYLQLGYPPTVRGTIACGDENCLLIEINETMQFSQQGHQVSGFAKGYMMASVETMQHLETALSFRTAVSGPSQNSVAEIYIFATALE